MWRSRENSTGGCVPSEPDLCKETAGGASDVSKDALRSEDTGEWWPAVGLYGVPIDLRRGLAWWLPG